MNNVFSKIISGFSASVFTLCLSLSALAQSGWQSIGRNDTNLISYQASGADFLGIDNTGTPYSACNSGSIYGKNCVKKYDGSSWTNVGSIDSLNRPDWSNYQLISMKISPSGVPFILIADSGGLTVKKFNGIDWTTVGSPRFGSVPDGYFSFTVDAADIPYVAYRDINHGNFIMTYNGSSWVYLANPLVGANSGELAMAVDRSGTLYVAFIQLYPNALGYEEIFVKKYNGGAWQYVGQRLTNGGAEYISLAIDTSGFPYVSYQDQGNGSRVTVKKYNGSSWVTLGTTVSPTAGYYTNICIAPNGFPYVVYQDYAYGRRTTVKGFNGSSWIGVGSPGFSLFPARYQKIVIDRSGTPYVIFTDDIGYSEVIVMKNDCHNWAVLGADTLYNRSVRGTSLTIDGSGTTYLAVCQDTIGFNYGRFFPKSVRAYNNGHWSDLGGPSVRKYGWISIEASKRGDLYAIYTDSLISVKKYIGNSSWSNIGAGNFAVIGNKICMTLDTSGLPYVAYSRAQGGEACVMRYDGNAWVYVGAIGFSNGAVDYMSIAIDSYGQPYVAYRDLYYNGRVSVQKYNGTAWVYVGAQGGISSGGADVSIAIDGTGTPYVYYRDLGLGNKASVVKYNGSNWTQVGSAAISTGSVLGRYSVFNQATAKKIAIDHNGFPYISFEDSASQKVFVLRYDGIQWINIGSTAASSNTAFDGTASFALDSFGTPYVAFGSPSFPGAGVYSYQHLSGCIPPTVPVLSSNSPPIVCAGSVVALSVQSGSLDSATHWQWYTGACGGTPIGSGSTIMVSPTENTNYYVRGEGGCVVPGRFAWIGVNTIATDTMSVYIRASSPALCGVSFVVDTFHVTSSHAGSSPIYQWYKNGYPIVGNNPLFIDTLVNNDSVWVVVTNTTDCLVQQSVSSDHIVVTSQPFVTPSVSISDIQGSLQCSILLTDTIEAVAVNAGSSPIYDWYLNGILRTDHRFLNILSRPVLGDRIWVVMTPSAGCATIPRVTSNKLILNHSDISQRSLCFVSIDTALGKPIVIWEKADKYATTSFDVYRILRSFYVLDFSTSVNRDSLSEYTDLSANPEANAYIYYMRVLDTCGNSYQSPEHQIIYLTQSIGTISWTQYKIGGVPVNATYDIFRDDLGNGNWQLLRSVDSSYYQIVDTNYTSYPNARYFVRANISNVCYPSRGLTVINSNIWTKYNVGIETSADEQGISILPNPTRDHLLIECSHCKRETDKIAVIDLLGQKIYEGDIGNESVILNSRDWLSGIYIVNISGKTTNFREKIVKW